VPGHYPPSQVERARRAREEAREILDSLTGSFWYRIGHATATAYIRRKEWLYRRVESIEFVGRGGLRRHISIDFERPDGLPDLKDRAAAGGCIVPVSVFVKWPPLMDLDFRGLGGEPLSIYKRTTNMQLDFGLLNGMAEEIGVEFHPSLARDLALLVTTNTPARTMVQDVIRDLLGALRPFMRPSDPWREAQITDIVNLASQLANSSILWAPVNAGRGDDCIVKFSYLESYIRKYTLHQVLIACSWHDRVFIVPLTHAGRYTRYHADVCAEAGIEFVRAVTRDFPATPWPSSPELTGAPEHGGDDVVESQPAMLSLSPGALGAIPSVSEALRRGFRGWRRRAPRLLGGRPPALPHRSSTRDDPGLSLPLEEGVSAISEIIDRRVHVYHPPRAARSHRIFLQLEMAASREGLVSHCLAMAIALALLMSVAFAELGAAAESLPALVVLLAAVPLVLGYLLVRVEDPLEREGIIGVRAMAIASGVLPLLGGLLLVLFSSSKHAGLASGHPDLAFARPAWAGLTILSWVIAIGLGWSWGMAASRPGQFPRAHRVQNIASVSALLCALSLLCASLLDGVPYHLTPERTAEYLRSHEAAMIAASALLVLGASALHGVIGGLRRLIRYGRRGRGERLTGMIVFAAGGAWIWGTTFAGILIAWEAMTIGGGARTAPLIAPALRLLNATLIPMAIVMLSATGWMLVRRVVIFNRERILGDPWLSLAGLALGVPLLLLRAGSVVSYQSMLVAPGVAWVGFALWLLCLAALIRDPIKDALGLRSRPKDPYDPDDPDDPARGIARRLLRVSG
jgi:hypothetical protein